MVLITIVTGAFVIQLITGEGHIVGIARLMVRPVVRLMVDKKRRVFLTSLSREDFLFGKLCQNNW